MAACSCRTIIATLLCLLICGDYFILPSDGKVIYNFVYYSYKKKPKLERQFKLSMRQCERYECSQEQGLDLVKCARICTAPECYMEIYGHDELEHGEVDVRSSSFKGCWRKNVYRANKADL
ncbi:uncharacterized protein LOC117297572 [Asterias rubens]|uniref:uncharacterized protein LOC117297572 n=1 Tax=Asterias rubens TaxID=7604 RepID=UPI001454FD37|nr:uncharacterized protein LOC117297572 [Asterias rubens]